MSENKEFALFKSAVPSCKYIFKDGSTAIFVNGRFATDNEGQIEELKAEIKAKHPTIYVDAKEKVTSAAHQDPIASLRAKIIAEYEAEQAAKKGRDFGNTDASAGVGAGLLTTATVESSTAESNTAKPAANAGISATAKPAVSAALAHLKTK